MYRAKMKLFYRVFVVFSVLLMVAGAFSLGAFTRGEEKFIGTVTYNLNGGSGIFHDQTCEADISVGSCEIELGNANSKPVRSGFVFCWMARSEWGYA